MTLIALWAAGCCVCLIALRRRLAPMLLSPVVWVAGSMVALALAGAWFYQDVANAPGGAGIRLIISNALVLQTAHLLLMATTAFLVGAAAGVARRPPAQPVTGTFRAVNLGSTARSALAVGCALPFVYTLFIPGVPYLLNRPFYLSSAYGGGVAAIAGQLSIAALLGCGLLTAVWTGAGRLVPIVLFLLYLLAFFGGATRVLALAPTLFALGAFVGAPGQRTRIGLVIAGLLSVSLIRLPLFLRSQVHHGLIPYLGRLPAYLVNTSGWDVVALNVLISFGIIGVTAYVQPNFPFHDLVVSLNPLPGRMAGWYEIADVHRLNVYTPYGTVGELGNVGRWAVVGYFVVLGLVMAHLDGRVQGHLRSGRQGPALLIVGLVALFCLYNQQYNLRQSTRMVYYALAIDLALAAWFWFRSRREDTTERERAPQPAAPHHRAAAEPGLPGPA